MIHQPNLRMIVNHHAQRKLSRWALSLAIQPSDSDNHYQMKSNVAISNRSCKNSHLTIKCADTNTIIRLSLASDGHFN